MGKYRAIIFIVTILLTLIGETWAQQHPVVDAGLRAPSKEASAIGVAEYRVTHSHDGEERKVVIEVIAQDQSESAKVTLDWDTSGATWITVDQPDTEIEILWDGAAGIFDLRDHKLNARGTLRLASDGWTGEPADSTLLDRNFSAIRLAAVVSNDYLLNSGHLSNLESKAAPDEGSIRIDEHQPLLPDGGVPGPRCTGLMVRGSGFGNARSYCCLTATLDANLKCWNDWCTGCCRFLTCDAACAVGDYFCVCGITGISCGPPC